MMARFVRDYESGRFVLQTRDAWCGKCGGHFRILVHPEFTDPIYVEFIETENKVIKEMLNEMYRDLLELAEECVNAGVRPKILRRADDLRKRLNELKDRLNE